MKLNRFIFSLLSITWLASAAQALPLLGETAGSIKVSGNITLYRDNANPKKVYYFPNSTSFSVDNKGVPLFNFVYWGLDNPATGGAYMTMTTHLASEATQKKDLEGFMAANPEVEVAVLPVLSSTVGLQTNATNQQPLSALFTEFNFAKYGGRAEDEIGVNAVLTGVGAKAFKALLKKSSGNALLKMDYCYKIQGLGPNMDAKIKVNMRRVYDYFQASHGGGWGWFSWDIQRVVETLVAEKTIQIEMLGGDAKDWEYLREVSEAITARLFVPQLSASQATLAAPSNRLFNFGAGSVHKEELQEELWTWKRQDLVTRDFCTNILIKDLEPYRDRLVISAD